MNCEVKMLLNQVLFSLLSTTTKIILRISWKGNTRIFVFSQCCFLDFVQSVNVGGYLLQYSDLFSLQVLYLTQSLNIYFLSR